MDKLNKVRTVMIGTPCYDGRIDVWYANSLTATVKMSRELGVEIFPIWLSYDALIQRARNDIMALMLQMNCDDLIFIDSDIEWRPEDFYKLLDHPVDVVGGTYPKKGDIEQYVAKILDPYKARDPKTGLLQADGLGTGFLRMTKRAVKHLWDTSPVYSDKQVNDKRLIFNVVVENNDLISEDIFVCQQLAKGGIPIWLDTTITCGHVGMKKYVGNFDLWLGKLKTAKINTPPTSQSYGNNHLNNYMINKGK